MKKIAVLRALLAVAFVAALPAVAGALISSYNLEDELKGEVLCYPGLSIPATASHAIGNDGIITTIPLTGVGFAGASATTLATFPHPARLGILLFDGAPDVGTLTCTSAQITGIDQFGTKKTEIVSSLTENLAITQNAFSEVTALTVLGCADGTVLDGGGTAADLVVLQVSPLIGLGKHIDKIGDIESVCLIDQSASEAALCAQKRRDGGSAIPIDITNTVSLTNDTIAIGQSDGGATYVTYPMFGNAAAAYADGDKICIHIRPQARTGR